MRSYEESRSEATTASCRGGVITHVVGGAYASCTVIEDGDECAGSEAHHDLSPRSCVDEWGSCAVCGVVG